LFQSNFKEKNSQQGFVQELSLEMKEGKISLLTVQIDHQTSKKNVFEIKSQFMTSHLFFIYKSYYKKMRKQKSQRNFR